MSDNPDRYDYDTERYYYDEDLDQVRSYDGEEAYDGNGEPINLFDD